MLSRSPLKWVSSVCTYWALVYLVFCIMDSSWRVNTEVIIMHVSHTSLMYMKKGERNKISYMKNQNEWVNWGICSIDWKRQLILMGLGVAMEKISILYKVMEIGAEHEYYSMTSGSLKFQEMQQLEIFQTSWSQDLFTHKRELLCACYWSILEIKLRNLNS